MTNILKKSASNNNTVRETEPNTKRNIDSIPNRLTGKDSGGNILHLWSYQNARARASRKVKMLGQVIGLVRIGYHTVTCIPQLRDNTVTRHIVTSHKPQIGKLFPTIPLPYSSLSASQSPFFSFYFLFPRREDISFFEILTSYLHFTEKTRIITILCCENYQL